VKSIELLNTPRDNFKRGYLDMEKYGFVYLWYDRKHKRFYIGCHWGPEDDGYISSSNWLKQGYRHRPKDFKRRILTRVYTNKKDLLEEEYRWLSKIKTEELGIKYYNLHNHHFNHWSTDENNRQTTVEKRKTTLEMSDAWKRFCESQKGKFVSEETKEKIREKRKEQTFSEETRRKLSDIKKGVPRKESTKKKISDAQKGRKQTPEQVEKNRNCHFGLKHTENTKQKMSNSHKGTKKPWVGKNAYLCTHCNKMFNVGNYAKHIRRL